MKNSILNQSIFYVTFTSCYFAKTQFICFLTTINYCIYKSIIYNIDKYQLENVETVPIYTAFPPQWDANWHIPLSSNKFYHKVWRKKNNRYKGLAQIDPSKI